MVTKRAAYDIASFKALPDTEDIKGQFEALVSVFGNVDVVGDRVLPGAFKKSLSKWQESGNPIPIIWSHAWGDPQAHIGAADPNDVTETDKGLLVKGRIDLDNPFAAQVFRLLKERRVREFSFGYSIENERQGKDGANELVDLDLIEAGPTLKGANPDTELLSVKSALEEAAAESKEEVMTEIDGAKECVVYVPEGKAGEIATAIDGVERELKKLRDLLTAGVSEEKEDATDEDKSSTAGEDEDPTPETDFELLTFKARIERMRD